MKFNLSIPSLVGLILSITCVINVANAGLIDNGYYTTDTNTGLHWLDLTETANYSYNDMLLQLDSGGLFEGWALASQSDVATLFNNSGGNGSYIGFDNNGALTVNLLNIWGVTRTNMPSNFYGIDVNAAWFYALDSVPGGNTAGGFLESNGSVYLGGDIMETDTPYEFIGAALYSTIRPDGDTQVKELPEPSTLIIFTLGIVALSRRFTNTA